MLLYGYPSVLSAISRETYIFNLSSMVESYPQLPLLIPPSEIGHLYGREFDIKYAEYIFSNDYVFCQFFQIIYHLYLGKDVFIIYSNEDWSENLIESLMKLIQQRYGYNGIMINTEEDYINAMLHSNPGFNPEFGIANLDQDKIRFTNNNISMRQNGRPSFFDQTMKDNEREYD